MKYFSHGPMREYLKKRADSGGVISFEEFVRHALYAPGIGYYQGDFLRVGFAAESENLVENAKAKVASKDLDLIVANDITAEGSGFGSDTNKVTLIGRDLSVEELPLLTKYDVGNRILDRVKALFRD